MADTADNKKPVDHSQGTLPSHLAHLTQIHDLDSVTAAHLEAAMAGMSLSPTDGSVDTDTSHIPSSVINHKVHQLHPGQQEVVLDPTTTVSTEHAHSELLRRYSGSEFNRP